MEVFYVVTLVVAVVTLILLMVILGVLMSYQTRQLTYPPKANLCPDHWTYNISTKTCDASNDAINNNKGAYSSKAVDASNVAPFANEAGKLSFNPDNPKWGEGATSATCAKRKWANDYRIVWDGISNYDGHC